KFPCGKIQRHDEDGQEKVTGTTASPDAPPEDEESTEAPSSHPEVTGETDSLPSTSPWQAVLLADDYDELICGGTILNEYFILTGANCVNQPRDLRVLVVLAKP
ncbi:PREDICTED: coagulation factor X-like, partial [Tauraco erythrolophus]|uniref:coagulation factor X-like n=1 Tax=Tauraco erythrolophus TaxID=121530 RepID=UPI0005233990